MIGKEVVYLVDNLKEGSGEASQEGNALKLPRWATGRESHWGALRDRVEYVPKMLRPRVIPQLLDIVRVRERCGGDRQSCGCEQSSRIR